jgi:hypothetical protein
MIPMNPKLAVLFLCVSLLPAAQARAKDKIILPDACGDDSTTFEVKAEEGQPAPTPPPEGKAQIVFIETMSKNDGCHGCDQTRQTTRFGVDGAWVGANRSNSYFAINVDPGVHHMCVQDQSRVKKFRADIALDSFTAELGKVYYYEINLDLLLMDMASGPGRSSGSKGGNPGFVLSQLGEDDGKYRVKAWKLATWKTK